MEVIKTNPLASDFTVLFQRIMMLAEELDGLREYYRALYQKIESGELTSNDGDLDLLKTFNVAGFVNLSIVSARAAQTAAIIANDVSLSRVFDPTLKTTERALRHIESGAHR
ncbi:hypothetical protein [Polynucleobacter asymbioticus]|uniref:Uncharacterized protein n=1 Tax=Polynucleobacter asymbioticus (strain DSM 18221 / CIP 109841 / QLW-P1DMWA-1) TaxID=312153 RepID=A4SY66_POLAQ|nr:hypothetical protein [Polynucleobacter asymbioticus]ABP34430.1 hypothetical protein Pnuc_1215 [Polynucleobacter asymbioticus QLW-P1DMWA-1]APC06273.1 hypothetical protein AOC10_06900 [Polynucleobacter asymbioticus]